MPIEGWALNVQTMSVGVVAGVTWSIF